MEEEEKEEEEEEEVEVEEKKKKPLALLYFVDDGDKQARDIRAILIHKKSINTFNHDFNDQ
jgi:hypothetical protein